MFYKQDKIKGGAKGIFTEFNSKQMGSQYYK
jgi:hypothetical protein